MMMDCRDVYAAARTLMARRRTDASTQIYQARPAVLTEPGVCSLDRAVVGSTPACIQRGRCMHTREALSGKSTAEHIENINRRPVACGAHHHLTRDVEVRSRGVST